MTQFARPASDISAGGWSDEGSSFNDGNLYTSIQEVTQDGDTSYILCEVGDGTCEVKLGTVTDPLMNTGHIVHVFAEATGGGAPERIDIELYQAGVLKATVASGFAPGRSGYVDVDYTLSGAEADSISDYTDLRVRMIEDTMSGADTMKVTQVYMEVPDPVGTLDQLHFRIREAGDGPTLNANTNWEAAIDINATMDVEEQFRIRFEIEEEGVGPITRSYKLQYNWSGDAGWNDVTAPGYPTPTGNVAVVAFGNSSQYADGDATTDVLSGSAGAFVAGSGEESNNTASVALTSTDHTEFEFVVMIRKLFAGAGSFTTDGQTVQFRVVESDGTVLTTYTQTPTITINHPVGLIGGVFAETTGQCGPIKDPNGNLYVVVEHAQLNSPIYLSVLKSTDGGDSWVPQDDADWTNENEGEALDTHYVEADDTIYIGWQASSDAVYREFLESTEVTNPDTFVTATVDVANPSGLVDQAAAIIRRSDDTTVMFYSGNVTDNKLFYKIRTAGGTWGSELTLEGEAAIDWTGVQACIGASDLIHIIYSNKNATGEIYYRNLNSGDTLSGRTSVLTGTDTSTHHSPILKPVFWDDGGDEKIMLAYYKESDALLYTRVVTNGTVGSEFAAAATDNAVASDIASSGQPTAKLAIDGTTTHIIYADSATQDIFHTTSVNGAAWNTDVELEDGVTCDLISANIFTHSAGNGSAKVLGYMYADNRFGEGNTGDVVYNELEIAVAATLPFYYTIWRRLQQT